MAARRARVLRYVLAANAVLLVAELVGGLAFHSLALLADAAHLGSDVVGLSIALTAQLLMTRPASTSHSYGLQRAEVLGAQANAVILLVTSAWVVFEAFHRIGSTETINGGGVVVVASLGLVTNLGGAWAVARVQGADLNLRGAFVHLAADAAGSVAAIGAGLAVLAFDAGWVDPVVSIMIALLVMWSVWSLLRDTTACCSRERPVDSTPGRWPAPSPPCLASPRCTTSTSGAWRRRARRCRSTWSSTRRRRRCTRLRSAEQRCDGCSPNGSASTTPPSSSSAIRASPRTSWRHTR